MKLSAIWTPAFFVYLCIAGTYAADRDRDAFARDVADVVAQLSGSVSLTGQTLAVGSIADASGQATAFSSLAASEVANALVAQAAVSGFSTADRDNIEQLAREWALGMSGMVDEETAAPAGKLAGVQVFLFGTYTRVSAERISLNLRLVDCARATVLASRSGPVTLRREYAALLDKPPAPISTAAAHSADGESNALSVKVWTGNESYRTGEKMHVSFQASHDCYVTLIDINPSGQAVIVFPNHFHRDNAVRGGKVYTIPDESMAFDFTIEPPPGIEILRAVASRAPVESTAGVLAAISESNPFAPVADPQGLTRGIRVDGRKAAPGTFADAVTRFRIVQ